MLSPATQPSPRKTMLYRFKSRATADLILLLPHARRLLEIIGKEPGAQGIITAAQIPAAVAALEAAVIDEERRAAEAGKTGDAGDVSAPEAGGAGRENGT